MLTFLLKMSTKNTPVQVPEDCGIIILFKDGLYWFSDLYRFADPLRYANTGAVFALLS